MTEDEIVRWNHLLNGHDYEQFLEDRGTKKPLDESESGK